MSSASTPDFRGTLRRQQQRRSNAPSLTHSTSQYGLSAQAAAPPPLPSPSAVAKKDDARTSDPTFAPLERAGRAINDGILKDNRFPDLDFLVQQGASTNYSLPEDPSWFPFQRTQILTIPDSIFAQYNKTQLTTQMGLFPEIQRAYITVDNRLYLWNYLNGEDFQSFSDSPQTLLAVRLIPPRPGVFLPSITYLLALCTSSTFFLLGIDTSAADGTFTLYNADMSVSVNAMAIKCIEATKDGRIFISGNDGHLWEVMYQADEGWFTSRTRKVCQTAGFGELILPNWGAAVETIEQIAIDDSRKLLYTLGSKSTIKTYHLNTPTTINQLITYSFPSMLSHISILSANSPLLAPKNTSIISLTPILAAESQRIYLVATTNTRVRLYVRAIKSYGPFAGGDTPVNNMQVIHVRFPPDQQTGQYAVLPLLECISPILDSKPTTLSFL
jgi:nuclear pore complex protein Nup155